MEREEESEMIGKRGGEEQKVKVKWDRAMSDV